MDDIKELIKGLSNTPKILKSLHKSISNNSLKEKRSTEKWTIHEHFCHLAVAEVMIYERFHEFKINESPKFSPYLPDQIGSSENLIGLNLEEQIDKFERLREQTVKFIAGFELDDWNKKAQHQEYYRYGSYIFLRHVLMHDYFHMYRIEELWLTKEEYFNKS